MFVSVPFDFPVLTAISFASVCCRLVWFSVDGLKLAFKWYAAFATLVRQLCQVEWHGLVMVIVWVALAFVMCRRLSGE